MDQWLFHAFKSGDLRLGVSNAAPDAGKDKKPNGKKGRRKGRADNSAQANPRGNEEILAFLKTSGMAETNKKEWKLKNRFTGYLSVAKSGVAFVPAGTKLEAVIPHAERARGSAPRQGQHHDHGF